MPSIHLGFRALPVLALALAGSAEAANWSQFGYDAAHSGYNPAETRLGATNIAQLVSLFPNGAALPATVDSAPIYQAGVATAGGTRDLLFALTSTGASASLLALDAANGTVVWSQQTQGKQPTTASPAIDPGGQYVYSYGVDGYAHKYAIGSGSEVRSGGWPQRVSLKTDVEKGAGGLTLASAGGANYLLLVTDGYLGDGGDYQGHLVSINLASGAQNVFNTMCSNLTVHLAANACAGVQSGIWGRGGATWDAGTGRAFIATGNGTFDANAGGYNWGDSVLALGIDGRGSGQGLPLDSYTPTNYAALDNSDTDLGSTSPVLLPVPAGSAVRHLGLQVGKDAQLRLLDLAALSGGDTIYGDGFDGGRRAVQVGGELQILAVPQGGSGMREQPAVWTNPTDASTWLFVANRQGLSGLTLGLDASHRPKLGARWTQSGLATSPILANGVLYHAGACAAGTCVIARAPLTGAVLWTSPAIGGVHWQSPIVVDGALYITDNSARLWKFGLP